MSYLCETVSVILSLYMYVFQEAVVRLTTVFMEQIDDKKQGMSLKLMYTKHAKNYCKGID